MIRTWGTVLTEIIGIHGAFSTPHSFNYLKTNLNYDWRMFDYSSRQNGLDRIIDIFEAEINQPSIIIGHSLGGIIALNLMQNKNVKAVITLASPVNGVKVNPYMGWFLLKDNFVHEITPYSKIIRQTNEILEDSHKPIFHINSTSGYNPFLIESNDGVITLKSQYHYKNPKFEVPANHHEILQHESTVEIISEILKKNA
jgi:pimeloyl-ACP methyl ester carboxylesterase